MDNFFIMSADTKVAEYKDGEVLILDDALAPIYLKNTGNFEKWVSERAIDASRTNSRHLKRANGLSPHASDFETAMFVHASCVTDNYWVKTEEEDLTWKDARQDNDIFFDMAVSSDSKALKPSKNPELTNIGSQEKGWKIIDGSWWLCKRERYPEPEYEYMTFKIGRALGFDIAEYRLDGDLIYTKDFTEGSVNLQHADSFLFDHEVDGRLVFDEDERYSYETLSEMDEALGKSYLDIIFLDALVNNTDRHTKNYGVLTSQEDGHIIKLAPNYDNNQSFYGYDPSVERSYALIKRFLDLINTEQIDYDFPSLDAGIVSEITGNDDALTSFIMDGYKALTLQM